MFKWDSKVDKKKSIKQRLQRCIELAHNILNTSAETGIELHEQGDKLDKMMHKVDIVDENVRNADKTLKNMSSFFGSLWGTSDYEIIKDNSWRIKKAKSLDGNDGNYGDGNLGAKTKKEKKQLKKLKNKHFKENFEEYVEDELDIIIKLTQQMKEMGEQISKELDSQNSKMEKLRTNVDDVNEKIHDSNRKIIKLL
jgi:hypothetical protein